MASYRKTQTRRVRLPFWRSLNLESLESRTLLSCTLGGFANSLVQNLTRIQAPINQLTNVANDVPLIENQLKYLPELQLFTSTRLQPIITQMAGVDPINQSAVQTALYNALGPSGLRMFSTPNQLTVTTDTTTCTVEVGMNFNYAAANVHSPANAAFGIGLNALPISIATKGGVDIGLTYSQTATFQFTQSAVQFTAGSINLLASATLSPGTSFEAVVGYIPVTITNAGTPSQPTGLTATYTATNVLTTPSVRFQGSANVYLNAAARLASGTAVTFPGISTDLELHWNLDTNNPALNPPTFAFKNVTLELGTALSDLIRPIVETVQLATLPIQPAIEILRLPLPGLNELSHAADGPDVTLQSLVDVVQQTGAFGPYGPLVQLISTLVDVTDIINQVQAGRNLKINFGTFDLGGNGDLRTLPPALGLSLNGANLTNLNPNGVGGNFDIGAVVQGVSNQLQSIANDPGNDPLLRSSAAAAQQIVQSYGNGIELTFPLIDNPMGCIFRLLLGQDVNLVQFFVADDGTPVRVTTLTFQVTVQATVDGDFNNDGFWNLLDIDALTAAISAQTNNPAFDLTGDALVNLADRDAWLAEAGGINLGPGRVYRLGDANLDSVVDGQDFIRWNTNKFSTTSQWSKGNFNADTVVDGQDFIIWNTNKFTSADAVYHDPSRVDLKIGLKSIDDVFAAIGRLESPPGEPWT